MNQFNRFTNNLFLDLRRISKVINQKRVLSLGIVGAPTSVGQPRPGVELGPDLIRSYNLIQKIENLGHDVIDFGNIDLRSDETIEVLSQNSNNNNKVKNELLVRQMYKKLSELVTKVVENKRIPVTLGGDHSTAIGSISANGSQRENNEMCVVWVDAHADINTVKSTKTGNFHGMPVSFLIKQVQQTFSDPNRGYLPLNPCIDAKNFAFIGLRDVEFSELEIIRKTKIIHFTTQDIDKLGIHEVVSRTLDQINPNLKRKIHVSFDIDAIDPIWAPSTGTAVPAGLTLREGLCIGEEIFATNMLCGLDLVEVNPKIGDQSDVKKTIQSTIEIILSFLGKTRIASHSHF